ncbi:MAG: polysaccharide biosynthesis protein, partial [Methylophilales bacterium 16-45-7]
MNFYRQYIVQWLSYIAMFHDVLVASVIWYIAFLLRFNFDIPNNFTLTIWTTLPIVLAIEFGCFMFFGLYRGLWRFASIPDLKRIIRAVALSALIIGFASLILHPQIVIPRSVLIINPLLLVLMMGGSRFTYRAWKERRLFNPIANQGKPVIVLGVEDAAITLIKDLTKSQEWRVVALLDDNKLMHGREFMHIRVEGAITALPDIAEKYSCKHCIIAMPSANHMARREAVNIANLADMEVLTLPAMSDLMSGKISVSQIRKVDVEDLLGRDVVNLDNQGLSAMIADNSVLVSGAAGSIGSELCRQVLMYHPKKLICIDISEYALYKLQQEFSQHETTTQILYIVADVKNKTRINHLLLSHQPKLV